MKLQEALQATRTSPLLSQFTLKQLGNLLCTFKLVSYAASHPESAGKEPPFDQIDAFMEANPTLVACFTKAALSLLQDLSSLGLQEVPSHTDFYQVASIPVGAVLAIAASGEPKPSMEQISECLDSPYIANLTDRCLTILWTVFYPGAPLANGKVHTLQSFAEECLKKD